jgi:UDP-N-acetylglucosamine 2-epimerase
MVAALAAAYRRTTVAHVEAGLRTDDLFNPFPEEINRRVVSAVAWHHFAPTARAAATLRREGIDAARIHVTGNTVIDALRLTTARIGPPPRRTADERRVLVTTHRRESFGDAMRGVLAALRTLADRNADIQIEFPVHLNPNVRGPAREILGGHPRINLLEPLGYQQFVASMADCDLILTDSGGIQEEAPYLGKPVLVMRDNTERPEAVECGAALLVGTDPEAIVREAERLLRDPGHYAAMSRAGSPFGDGHAAGRIVDALEGANH